MNAKSIWLAVMMILAMGFGAGAKTKVVESQWAQAPLKIDGLPNDWGTDAMAIEDSMSIEYAFQNDAKNLYFIVMFSDPRYLSSINQTGMTIWINLEGKKKKKQGIKFQYKMVPVEMMIQMLEMRQGAPLSEEAKQKLRQVKMHEIKQCYLIEGEETPIPLNHPLNPVFEARRVAKKMAFEFQIPLPFPDTVNPAGAKPGLEPGKQVFIGFEWGGMTEAMRGDMLRRSSVRMDDGNRELDTGALTQGDEREGRREGFGHMSGPPKRSFWSEIKLAQKQ